MTYKCLTDIFTVDSATVVRNSDIGYSASLYFKRDLIRSCVNRILHYFLNNRCRTLDNLACGDKLGNVLWQYINLRHKITSFSSLIFLQPVRPVFQLIELLQSLNRRKRIYINRLELVNNFVALV